MLSGTEKCFLTEVKGKVTVTGMGKRGGQSHHECTGWHLEKPPLWAGAANGSSVSACVGRKRCLSLEVGTDSHVLQSFGVVRGSWALG